MLVTFHLKTKGVHRNANALIAPNWLHSYIHTGVANSPQFIDTWAESIGVSWVFSEWYEFQLWGYFPKMCFFFFLLHFTFKWGEIIWTQILFNKRNGYMTPNLKMHFKFYIHDPTCTNLSYIKNYNEF